MAGERYQLIDTQIFLSKLAETATNTPYVLTADYVGALINSMMPAFPDVNRTGDGHIGDGKERRKLRRGWINPFQLPIGGSLNCETAARIGNRLLSGTRTASAELTPSGSTAYDVTTIQQTKAQGRIPKLSTIGFDIGAYKFVHASCAVSSFEIAFNGSGDVTWAAQLMGTGMYKVNLLQAALESAGFTTAQATAIKIGTVLIVPPTPPTHHLMHPAATKVTFSDGTTRDFASDGDLIAGGCGMQQNVVVKQLPGDPFIVTGVRKSGAYARDVHRGTRVPSAQIQVALQSDLRSWVLSQNGTQITSLTYLFRSEEPIGDPVNGYFYEFEWTCPVAEVEAVQSNPDGEDAAIIMSFYPENDPTTDGYWIQRIRTDNNLLQ